jgi:hypothetical protein
VYCKTSLVLSDAPTAVLAVVLNGPTGRTKIIVTLGFVDIFFIEKWYNPSFFPKDAALKALQKRQEQILIGLF